nr:immunoglobulin heavy chain junction region [Mus musculus]
CAGSYYGYDGFAYW